MRLIQFAVGPLLAGSLGLMVYVAGAAETPKDLPMTLSGKSPSAATSNVFAGNTRPSDRRSLSMRMMVVGECRVEPMAKIKKGEVLIQGDDRDERARLEFMKKEADSDVVVRKAITTRDQAKVELERMTHMFKNKVASQEEYDKARLERDLSELAIEESTLQLDVKKLQVKYQQTVIDTMQVVAPFDGVVEDVLVRAGEVIDPQKPSIVVVRNDPVWVEVHLPTPLAQALRKKQESLSAGQKLELGVMYPDSTQPVMGEIIYYNPFADAASNTQLVRLRLANPEGRPSGLQVQVVVPDDVAKVAQAAGQR